MGRLWEGSTADHGDDDSAADQALCNRLAWWTGNNAAEIERVFSLSGLGQREKWQSRPDYRERTISKALEGGDGAASEPSFSTNGHASRNGTRSASASEKERVERGAFWTIAYTKKGINVEIEQGALVDHLQTEGYGKLYPSGARTSILVHRANNIVGEVSTEQIKDETLRFVEQDDDAPLCAPS